MTVEIVNSRNRMFLGIVSLVIFVVIMIVGLWPFNFWPENKVRWLKDQNGIQFYGQGIICSPIPLFQSSSLPTESTAIEIDLQPESVSFPYIAHILSVYDHQGLEIFFIGQWKSHLILQRKMKDENGRVTPKEISLQDALPLGMRRHITITSEKEGTSIYMNGRIAKVYPHLNLLKLSQGISGRAILGNSLTGNQYWIGNLFDLVIFKRSLTQEEIYQHSLNWTGEEASSLLLKDEGLVTFYPFKEKSGNWVYDHMGRNHLFIPSRFEVLQKPILTPPWKDFRLNRSYLMDILTNILGFIPFGFFFSAYLRTKQRSVYRLFLISIFFAGFTSLTIELAQVYLPTRSSQLMDIITNILGTALGVSLFYHCQRLLI
jgi:VanZ family protein